MKKKLALIFIFFSYITSCPLFLFAQLPVKGLKLHSISSEQGLSNADVRHILHDSRGYIWLGTRDGLNRYDGYTCKFYKNEQNNPFSLANNSITFICEDSQKNIWIGTGAGISKYRWDKDNFETDTNFANRYITRIKEDTKGNLWATGAYKIAIRYKGLTQWKSIEKDFPTVFKDTNNVINDIVEGHIANEYWLASALNGIYRINTKTKSVKHFFKDPKDSNSLPDNNTNRIIKDRAGMIWLATRYGGVVKINPINEQITAFNTQSPKNNNLLVNSIFNISEIGEYIYAATENGGVGQIDKNTGEVINFIIDPKEPQGMSDNSIKEVYQDRQNRIWIATLTKGALVWDKLKEKFVSENIPLLNQTVNAVLKDKKNRIWVCTEGGIVLKEKDNIRYFESNPKQAGSLSSNAVLGIYEDPKGQIWFGTWLGGINLYDEPNDRFISYFHKDIDLKSDVSLNNVYSILYYPPTKELIAGSFGGVIAINTNLRPAFGQKDIEPLRRFFRENGNQISYLKMMYVDGKQDLWMAGWRHLSKWDHRQQKLTYYEENPQDSLSISHNNIHAIYEDRKNRFWVGTSNGLNLKIGEGKFKRFFVKDGLPDNYIYSILEDNEGNLWLGTGKGLSKFNPDKITFKNFDNGDGLKNLQFMYNSAYKAQDGQMFFGGVKGVDSFYPAQVKDNPYSPTVYLADFKLFNKSVKIGEFDSLLKKTITETKEITLNHRQSIFTIEFIALNLTQSQKNQYAYILEGLEKDWNYVGSQRSATYTNLDAGTYTFRVKASNNDGLWNEEGASIKITILPPWWATWWFRTIVLTLFLSSGIVFYFVRINAVKRQNQRLEKTVRERTKQLEFANHEVKAKNEELQTSEEELRQNMEELEANQELLKEQKQIIEVAFVNLNKQNTKVNDSIRYAQRIQNAILPHQDILTAAFSEHFVVFKPKDVVSGDFYWYLEIENKKFLAIVDCTGHGVPGAFMSMIGNTLLYEIINAKRIFEPHHILEELHIGILHSLNSKDAKMQDGMDIALCCIESNENGNVSVQYSGAKRPLYYFSKQELVEVQADRKSIGQAVSSQIFYQLHEIKLQVGDTLYMSTDGWIDSINPERRRFGRQQFKEMLLQGANLSLKAQEEVFRHILEDYEQGTEQRDDVLLVGVKV